jgi:hypothetical protein
MAYARQEAQDAASVAQRLKTYFDRQTKSASGQVREMRRQDVSKVTS